MSIMFQLFSADDLKRLVNSGELLELRVDIGMAMRQEKNFLIEAAKDQFLPKVLEEARRTQEALPDEEQAQYRQEASMTLRGRVKEVFQQLRGQEPRHQPPEPQLDFMDPQLQEALANSLRRINEADAQTSEGSPISREAIRTRITQRMDAEEALWRLFSRQLLDQTDYERLTELEQEILKLAITCELDNFNLYNALNSVKKSAHDAFEEDVHQRAEGPDTVYALLNRIP